MTTPAVRRREFEPPPALLTPPAAIPTASTVEFPAIADEAAAEPVPVAPPVAIPGPRRLPAPPPLRPIRRRRAPRPWIRLPAAFVLLMLVAFVGWVSAEPFWLSVGHGRSGIATVVSGPPRCQAVFAASDGTVVTSTVDLAGLRSCAVGATVPAKIVSPESARAYADEGGLRLRWVLGAVLLIVIGWTVALVTGTGRFVGWRRFVATAVCLAAPWTIALVILAGLY